MDIAQIIANTTGLTPEEVTDSSRLVEDLGLDSLSVVEIAVRCEDAFGVRVEEEAVSRFSTVGDVRAYIERAAAEKA